MNYTRKLFGAELISRRIRSRMRALLMVILPPVRRLVKRNEVLTDQNAVLTDQKKMFEIQPHNEKAERIKESEGTVFKIGDRIVCKTPTPQTALDIFKGIWISRFPGKYSQYDAGQTPLFEDTRIADCSKFLGSVKGKNVLDLGPLEGGQAYVLEKMGARSVVSVEANTILYLKCLVAKEVLHMQRVRFLCGDVVEYLKGTSEDFDICVASGILYHMDNPVELLWLLSRKTDKLLIWTHYFDEVDDSRNKITSFKPLVEYEFQGKSYNYHRQEYGVGFTTNVYCGGTKQHSNWMTREGIMTALKEFGYIDINVLYDKDTVSGPSILIAASK